MDFLWVLWVKTLNLDLWYQDLSCMQCTDLSWLTLAPSYFIKPHGYENYKPDDNYDIGTQMSVPTQIHLHVYAIVTPMESLQQKFNKAISEI